MKSISPGNTRRRLFQSGPTCITLWRFYPDKPSNCGMFCDSIRFLQDTHMNRSTCRGTACRPQTQGQSSRSNMNFDCQQHTVIRLSEWMRWYYGWLVPQFIGYFKLWTCIFYDRDSPALLYCNVHIHGCSMYTRWTATNYSTPVPVLA